MQESQDRSFNDCIARALRAETTLTPQQQQHAWEALRAKVAQQAMLPAPKPSLIERLRDDLFARAKPHLMGLYHLFMDDSVYRRVQNRYPMMMRHQRPHSTFAAAEFMLLA
jgi:hypothetical protein